MRGLWTVTRREFRSYFDHPTAYILIIAFLGLGLFLSFRSLYASGIADLRSFFTLLPWLFVVFIPAITMRSLAEERGRGTLEWLMAQPVSELELVAGKFLGDWLFALVALAGTLPMALGVWLVSGLGLGSVVAQYLGGAFLAAQLVALGIFASSLTRNQITAFILGATVTLALVLAGARFTLMGLPPQLAGVVRQLSVIPHVENVARGVIDLRDVLYFVSTTGLFLLLAYVFVLRQRLSTGRGAYRRLRLGTAVAVVGVVVLNLLGGRIRGRIDLTPDRLYTLSDGTRQLLDELDDIVTVKLFVSDELPPEVQTTLRDVRDLLADYRRFSDGRIRVEEVDPSEDDAVADEAASYGISRIQFNVLREEEFEVRSGWFGLALLYADEHETIPVLGQTDDLEYRLSSSIASMTATTRAAVAFLTGAGARAPARLPELNRMLSQRYTVTTVSATDSTLTLDPDSMPVLVVAGPTQALPEPVTAAIADYLDAGGAGLFLVEHVQIDPRAPIATPVTSGLEALLAERGARVSSQMLYDLRSNQQVSLGQRGGFSYIAPYPLWPVALRAGDHAISRGLEQLALAWASPIEITDSARVTPLFETTEFGGRQAAGGPISPDALPEPSRDELGRQLVAVAVGPPAAADGAGDDGGDGAAAGGRLVVIGDANLADAQFTQASPQNLVFLANAIDWLAQDEALIAIRSKDRTPPPLVFESEIGQAVFKWANLIGVPLLFVVVGLLWSLQRRRHAELLREEVGV